ncbi:MAG: tetratricopeptide repeat protein, partial [bacterium]|nr:tetratricopeptide repeat protein [bacterium]
IVVMLLLPAVLSATETMQDLEGRLKQLTGKERVPVLVELTYLTYTDLPKCLGFGREAVTLSQRYDMHHEEARALICISGGYMAAHQKETSLDYAKQALLIYQQIGATQQQGWCLERMGLCYRDMGKPDAAISCFHKGLQLGTQFDSLYYNAYLLNELGAVYYDVCLYEKALKCYHDSRALWQEMGNERTEAQVDNNIGMVFFDKGEYKRALHFYKKSLKIRIREKIHQGVGGCLDNIGVVYLAQGDYAKALKHFQNSLEIRKTHNYQQDIATSQRNIGIVFQKTGRFVEASARFQNALEIAEAINDKKSAAETLMNMGVLYMEDGKHQIAESTFLNSLELAEETSLVRCIISLYHYMSQLYETIGNHKKAHEFSKKHAEMSQQLREKNNQLGLSVLEIENREKEHYALLKENHIRKLENRNQIIIAAAVISVLMAFLLMFYRHNQSYKNELIHKEERRKRLELESRLKLFQARINPHFLFNSLDSIRELGYENKPKEMEEVVQTLSDMYRRILTSHEKMQVPLESELRIISDFLEIKKRMSNGRLEYDISVEDGLENFPVLPLSIEPLVENCLIHGIPPRESGRVNIDIHRVDKMVKIDISDNGAGFDSQKMEMGFGLYSVRERLKLFYKDKAAFRIS